MQHILDVTTPFLARLEAALPALASPPAHRRPSLPAVHLQLQVPEDDMEAELGRRGCSEQTASLLAEVYRTAVGELVRSSQAAFATTWQKLNISEGDEFTKWYFTPLQSQYTRDFGEKVTQLAERVFAEVDADQAARWEDEEKTPRVKPALFTEDQVAVLRQLKESRLARGEKMVLTLLEKDAVGKAIGLTASQIGTWFNNQRNRAGKQVASAEAKHAVTAKFSLGHGRPCPYPSPSDRPSRRAAPQTPSPPMRNFSNSSMGSNSSVDSVLSYEPPSSDAEDVTYPSVPHQSFLPSGAYSMSWDNFSPSSSGSSIYGDDAPSEQEDADFLATLDSLSERTPTANSFAYLPYPSPAESDHTSLLTPLHPNSFHQSSPTSTFLDPDSWFPLGPGDDASSSLPPHDGPYQNASSRAAFEQLYPGQPFDPVDLDLCGQIGIASRGALTLPLAAEQDDAASASGFDMEMEDTNMGEGVRD